MEDWGMRTWSEHLEKENSPYILYSQRRWRVEEKSGRMPGDSFSHPPPNHTFVGINACDQELKVNFPGKSKAWIEGRDGCSSSTSLRDSVAVLGAEQHHYFPRKELGCSRRFPAPWSYWKHHLLPETCQAGEEPPPKQESLLQPSEAICTSSRTLGLFVTALEEEVQSLHLLGVLKEYGSKVSTSNISSFEGKDLCPVQIWKRWNEVLAP